MQTLCHEVSPPNIEAYFWPEAFSRELHVSVCHSFMELAKYILESGTVHRVYQVHVRGTKFSFPRLFGNTIHAPQGVSTSPALDSIDPT